MHGNCQGPSDETTKGLGKRNFKIIGIFIELTMDQKKTIRRLKKYWRYDQKLGSQKDNLELPRKVRNQKASGFSSMLLNPLQNVFTLDIAKFFFKADAADAKNIERKKTNFSFLRIDNRFEKAIAFLSKDLF